MGDEVKRDNLGNEIFTVPSYVDHIVVPAGELNQSVTSEQPQDDETEPTVSGASNGDDK